jgi:ankyrin repeat protein
LNWRLLFILLAGSARLDGSSKRNKSRVFAMSEILKAGPESWKNVHAAVSHNDWPTLIALLKSGHSIDAGDEQGDSPLYVACHLGQGEAVKKLVQFGANLEARNDAGHTPLMAAAVSENVEAVEVLLKARANAKAKCSANQQTVLHWALAHPPKDPSKVAAIVRMLLAAGAEVNQKARDGTTPLMQATWFGSEHVIPVLLGCGADPNLGDNRGRNACQLAKERGFSNICQLLESAVAALKTRKKESLSSKLARWWNG